MDAELNRVLATFASAWQGDSRLFSLYFADASLNSELLPHALVGEEHISACYKLDLTCLSSDASLELKSLIAQAVYVAVHLNDGSERVIAGIVTAARQLGSDGGFARYGLTIEPALAALKLRRNSRVFQDKSVVDIVGLILDEHIQNNPVFAQCFRRKEQLAHAYPTRSYCQQYRETDLAFIERLLREEGISYYFDFERGTDEVGLHTLVIFDNNAALNAALQTTIRFHRADATEQDDTITEWHAQRQIQPGAVQLASFDYKRVYAQQGGDSSRIDQGEAGFGLTAALEDYDPQALYYSSDNSDLKRYATLRQQAYELGAKTFSGSGVVRGLGAGQWFTFDDHPAHEDDGAADRQFVVLTQRFSARNNLLGDFKSLGLANSAKSEAGYHNSFQAVRKAIPIVPAYAHTEHAKPTAHGVQSATVVGPVGEEIYTDELGRVKIQFHWARTHDHDVAKHGAAAANDDHSSCWVRVQMPSAGAQWGHQFIPRIGQEVLVDFLEGDIDRPVITHVVHNGQQTPPTFQGAGSLPANKTLSGIKSREHKGSRHNEIVFDDTTGEIRAMLASEHGKTQLNQGYLIHPRSEGNGTPRGEGFELRTDNAGTVRSAHSLLITTEPQLSAGGKQLDRSAALAQLEAAQNLTQQLGDVAKNQNANQPQPEPALNVDLLKDKKSHVLMHGHGGITLTTPQSVTVATGKDLNQVSQRDTHQSSGRHWIHNVGESISILVAGTGNKLKDTLKLIAAKGNILMQAQKGDVEITADKKITLTACKEKLTASAGKTFLLQSGGGYIKIEGGNIDIHCPGKLSMKAAKIVHESGSGASLAKPVLSEGVFTGVNTMQMSATLLVAALGAASLSTKSAPSNIVNAQKAERWKARKKQIADAKAKASTMAPGKKRDQLVSATQRFEKNNVAVEKARLSADVYDPENGPPPGWKNISNDAEQLDAIGLKKKHLSEPNSNFRVQVYAPDPEVFGDDMKTTVSFKGTDFDCKEDWANNIAQGVDRESLYYKKAVEIGKQFRASDANAEITGHSLGGGLGSAAARASGKPATTFNAAGLHKNTVTRYGGTPVFPDPDNLEAYRVDGEVLTGAQEQKLGGITMTAGAGALIGGLIGGPAGAAIGAGIGAAGKVGLAAKMPNAAGMPHTISGKGLNPVDRHGMTQVIDGIEMQKQQDQSILSTQVGGPDGKG